MDPAQRDRPARSDDDFRRDTEPYRRELLAHCYRMLGSLHDAEDAFQETLVRAWRGLAGFAGRSSFRTWLHRIATNVCLDAIGDRGGRVLAPQRGPAASADTPLPAPIEEPIWLEPFPDAWLGDAAAGPDTRYAARESVAIAFMTAIQLLPARQRAALLMRDVAGMSAEETAEALETSVAAVNSALQRARATLDAEPPRATIGTMTPDAATAELLARYVAALESGDFDRLLAVLRDDAILTMPPFPLWLTGAPAIVAFHHRVVAARGRTRLVATRANGAPAYAVYQDGGDGYRLAAVTVVGVAGDRIEALHTFLTGPGSPIARSFELPDAI